MEFRSSAKFCPPRRVLRRAVSKALHRAFPARSEHEMCCLAAAVLNMSPDTVRRLLREEQDAKLAQVWPILAMGLASAGVDALSVLEGDE